MRPAQFAALKKGFVGPRPGSNSFPFVQLGKDDSRIDGEELEALFRSGYLTARPARETSELKGGDAGPYGEIPDVELSFAYELTPAGLLALSSQDGRE